MLVLLALRVGETFFLKAESKNYEFILDHELFSKKISRNSKLRGIFLDILTSYYLSRAAKHTLNIFALDSSTDLRNSVSAYISWYCRM